MDNPYAAPDAESSEGSNDVEAVAPVVDDTSDILTDEARKLFEQEGRIRSGANWFFWIAGTTVVNSAVFMSGGDWGFAIGLGITQFLDGVSLGVSMEIPEAAFVAQVITKASSFVAIVVFVGIGILARRLHGWAFILGMVLYAFDALVFLLASDLVGIGLHAFSLFCIWQGYIALRNRREMQLNVPAALAVESTG